MRCRPSSRFGSGSVAIQNGAGGPRRGRTPWMGDPREPNRSGRRGGVLPFLIVLMTVCLGMAAFALDFSRMYLIRAQLQIAADAGALAGAQRVLVGKTSSGFDTATLYARNNLTEKVSPDVAAADVLLGTWKNGTFTSSGSWMDANANAVQVTARRTAGYIFGRIFNQTTRALSATSVAVVGSVGSMSCVRPFAIPYESLLEVLYPSKTPDVTYDLSASDIVRLAALTEDDEIELKVGSSAKSPVSGNFYAVREGPVQYANGTEGDPWSGANNYRDAIGADCSSLTPVVGVGDWLQAEQGNMQGPTRQGLADLCGVNGNPQSFKCTPEVKVYIPIWDIADKSVSSPNAFRVKYMGGFMVTGYSKNDGISGYFSSMAGPGGFTSQPGPIKKIALVK